MDRRRRRNQLLAITNMALLNGLCNKPPAMLMFGKKQNRSIAAAWAFEKVLVRP